MPRHRHASRSKGRDTGLPSGNPVGLLLGTARSLAEALHPAKIAAGMGTAVLHGAASKRAASVLFALALSGSAAAAEIPGGADGELALDAIDAPRAEVQGPAFASETGTTASSMREPRGRTPNAPIEAGDEGLGADVSDVAPLDASEPKEKPPAFGLGLDVGVPDGLNLFVNYRPWSWLRLHAGGSHNGFGLGLRGGLSLVPFDSVVTPSLVAEGGYFFRSDLAGFVADITGRRDEGVPEEVEYAYGNLHLGLEFGSPSFTFYLRGGYSLIHAVIQPAQPSQDGLRFEGDARVNALVPSAKLGFIFYLF